MLVLAIDTSSAAVTAALARVTAPPPGALGVPGESRVQAVAHRSTENPRGHSELLASSISQCLAEAGAGPADIDAVVAGLGPGPFTGVRVGLVSAAALAHALDVPSYGVCSLDAIAGAYHQGAGPTNGLTEQVPDWPGAAGSMLVVTDARRHEVYWAAYRDGVRVAGPGVCRPADLPPARCAAGAGATMYAEVLRARGTVVLHQPFPSPWALVRAAADRILAAAASDALVPLYLRSPDAVPGVPKAVRP